MLHITLPDPAHALWLQLLIVVLFGFLTGLEIREYRLTIGKEEPQLYFGSTRTYTFLALVGWVLNLISPISFYMGLGAFTLLYLLLYWKQLAYKQTSLLMYLIGLLVYHYGVLVAHFPLWLLVAVFVAIVFLLHMREQITRISQTLAPQEIFTLAKLLLLSAVILPLLPQQPVAGWLPVSPFKIWLAVVVVSTISYLGYIAQRYLFREQGILVTALFGGLYSSTATTVVLARQSRDNPRPHYRWSAGIVLATGMMYLRLLAIAAIFQWQIARYLLLPMVLLALMTLAISLVLIHRERRKGAESITIKQEQQNNPLDLKIAFTFAALFVLMTALTDWVSHTFGSAGLNILSLIVGFTDIDPFVLSLLTGQFKADALILAQAILIAAGSNNFLKAVYALWFGEKHTGRLSALWLGTLGAATIFTGWLGLS